MNSVAIFGGTFDPIHCGHLRTALELKQVLELDQMRMLPCHVPPHRGIPRCTETDRLKMVQLAVANESGLVCDDREIDREGVSYMVDTLTSLREELGELVSLSLVVGMDSFLTLPAWHEWEQLPQLAHIIVAARPGVKGPQHGIMGRFLHARETTDIEDIKSQAFGRVLLQHMTPLDISSTYIRQLIMAGNSARYLLPDSVWDYIEQHHLFRAADSGIEK